MLRLIEKWFKAGVSEDGRWSETNVSTPQAAAISPLLANLPALCFGLLGEAWRKNVATGDVIVVGYLLITWVQKSLKSTVLRRLGEMLRVPLNRDEGLICRKEDCKKVLPPNAVDASPKYPEQPSTRRGWTHRDHDVLVLLID
jgi:hypothetical protein